MHAQGRVSRFCLPSDLPLMKKSVCICMCSLVLTCMHMRTLSPVLQGAHTFPGQLLLSNTLEAMRRTDKAAVLQQVGQQVWADILSGAAEAQPQLLNRFLLLAYGDLKHFVFHYW